MGPLAKKVLAATLGALTGIGRLDVCDHGSDKLTYVRGNVVHCKCGQAFKVACTHIFVAKLMPRFYQCQDCFKNVTGEGD